MDAEWTPPGPGPWMQDRAHVPSSVTLLLQESFAGGFGEGFGEAMAPYGSLIDRLNVAFVNGFTM